MSHPSSPSVSAAHLATVQAIKRSFSSRPSLQEVAVDVLQASLGRSYRWLNIDQAQPVLMEPVYRYDGKTSVLEGHNSLTLVDALIERCVSGIFVDYNQGQILAASPADGEPAPLHVKSSDLEAVINEEGSTLIARYQEALIHYWVSTDSRFNVRYLDLADKLKEALLTAAREPGVSHEYLDMVVQVIARPVPDSNAQGVRAYLVDQWGEVGAANVEVLRGLVLIKPREDGQIVLLFTLARGIQVFGSQAELGQWLVNLLTPIPPGHRQQWRLYQPKGNIFYSFSLTFLAKQLADIENALAQVRTFDTSQRLLERTLKVITSDFDVSPHDATYLARLRAALPAWLLQADPDLQTDMSQYVTELAQQIRQPGWKPFDEGIPALADFARSVLQAQLAKDYPQHPELDPDHIHLKMVAQEPDPTQGHVFWALPPLYTDAHWTLSELAWLVLPSIDPRKLQRVPAEPGETDAGLSVEQLIEVLARANVRAAYGQLVSAKLKDDEEARWRKVRFCEQWRVQLPRLALEYHLKYAPAFSRRAYRYVAALVQTGARKVQGQAIVLRPLAFQSGQGVDRVTHMFIIGPLDTQAGPHILYRPLAGVKLIEFASWDALLAAFVQAGPLQYQAMAWLPSATRRRYLAPGLAVPGLAAFGVVDFNDSLWADSGLALGTDVVEGDYHDHLFNSLVEALLDLADPVPASGLEAFWDWIKRHFVLGLALVLPLVGGPVGEAASWL
ncbi:dermonecrotic toxin domain-containing protein [Pseudomonas sp. SDO528_S397]